MSGTLYIVATPIGNLDDLTPRARQTLADVDLIAAEDTRHTGRLLSHIGAQTRQIALHDHNEESATRRILEALAAGKDVALVSDAGTPLVSDPGYRLVRAAHEADITVSPLPGACAAIAGLSIAGLPSDRFCFEGFLPARKAARRSALDAVAGETRTLVFYESVHRIEETLTDMSSAFGTERDAFIGRELTKLHEQGVSGTLGELAARIADGDIKAKGEFVIVVAGADPEQRGAHDADTLLKELSAVLPARTAAAVAAKVTGGRRNEMYARLLELGGSAGSREDG